MIRMNVVDFSAFADVRVLAGSETVKCSPLPVFSDESCAFLDAVSKALMRNPQAKRYSDVVSFAYWCRKGNVMREKQQREGIIENRLGRGFALHIAPSNVPVNFAFSYVFSLLAGNATVVRCPSKAFDQVEIILDAMREQFANYPAIGERSAFVTYPSSGETTKMLSSVSDVRVIWGGDATVASIRALPSKPRCIDIAFADRYSIALVVADAVNGLDELGLQALARSFYNDTYLMDQNACSSPQTILWVGEENAVDGARAVFWEAVDNEARQRYQLQAAVAVDKYVQLCGDAIRGIVRHAGRYGGYLTTVEVDSNQRLSTDLRGVGGYFYEKRVESLSDISDDVSEKYQTLVQFGYDSTDLRKQVIDCQMMGVDRIVDFGSAMDIGLIWDGFDLIDAMSRIVSA